MQWFFFKFTHIDFDTYLSRVDDRKGLEGKDKKADNGKYDQKGSTFASATHSFEGILYIVTASAVSIHIARGLFLFKIIIHICWHGFSFSGGAKASTSLFGYLNISKIVLVILISSVYDIEVGCLEHFCHLSTTAITDDSMIERAYWCDLGCGTCEKDFI